MAVLAFTVVALAWLAAVSIIWSSIVTGIAPMPSSRRAVHAMLAALARVPEPGPFVDLGSGWGTLAIALAQAHPGRQVIGYERSWLPWCVSSLRRRVLGLSNLSLRRADFRHADLSDAAALLCYLFPRGMQDVADQLARQGCRPAVIVSNTFALPLRRADEVVWLGDLWRTPVYVYRLPRSPGQGGLAG